MLVSPIILYDHPQVAEQSDGRVVRLDRDRRDPHTAGHHDDRRGEGAGRATDPLAAAIIDRCDAMSPEAMQRLHGVLRDPTRRPSPVPEVPDGVDWWDPVPTGRPPGRRRRPDRRRAGGTRQPGTAASDPAGRRAGHLRRRRTARVTAVHADVDGNTHVAVVVDDDPAADLHEWYGRYLYFAPDELEPLDFDEPESHGKEFEMDVIGWIATTSWSLIVLAGVVIGVRSIPDVQRYMRDAADVVRRGSTRTHPDRRHRQHLPRRRRLRPRGDPPSRGRFAGDDAVRVADYGIGGMHLAYDLLDDWARWSWSTPCRIGGRPGHCTCSTPTTNPLGATAALDAHGMDPAAVFASLSALGGTAPRTVVVGCEALDTGDGIGLSQPRARSAARRGAGGPGGGGTAAGQPAAREA